MLGTLETFGLHWDGEVEFQSRRTPLYARRWNRYALSAALLSAVLARELADNSYTGYPGTCRDAPTPLWSNSNTIQGQ